MDESAGLRNRWALAGLAGSNPVPSTMLMANNVVWVERLRYKLSTYVAQVY